MPDDALYAWRFANADGTSRWQMEPQAVGVLYRLPTSLPRNLAHLPFMNEQPIDQPCLRFWGFHAATLPLTALFHGAQCVDVERVRLSGKLVTEEGPIPGVPEPDLAAASERTTLWRADASRVLLAFCIECAERAVANTRASFPTLTVLTKSGGSWDSLAKRSLQTARSYMDGIATGYDVKRAYTFFMAGRPSEPVPQPIFCANKAVNLALSACHAHVGGARPGPFYHIADLTCECAERTRWSAHDRAAAAWAEAAESAKREAADKAEYAEHIWQNDTLHKALMTLAPAGYSETWEIVAPLLLASANAGKEIENAHSS